VPAALGAAGQAAAAAAEVSQLREDAPAARRALEHRDTSLAEAKALGATARAEVDAAAARMAGACVVSPSPASYTFHPQLIPTLYSYNSSKLLA